jgi:nucleolar protein 9
VWRNWSLDLFKRRRGEWVNTIKAHASSLASVQPQQPSAPAVAETEDGDLGEKKKDKKGKGGKDKKARGKPEHNPKAKAKPEGKSAIQLAREKFAAAKAEKLAGGPSNSRPSFKNAGVKGRGTGANAA